MGVVERDFRVREKGGKKGQKKRKGNRDVRGTSWKVRLCLLAVWRSVNGRGGVAVTPIMTQWRGTCHSTAQLSVPSKTFNKVVKANINLPVPKNKKTTQGMDGIDVQDGNGREERELDQPRQRELSALGIAMLAFGGLCNPHYAFAPRLAVPAQCPIPPERTYSVRAFTKQLGQTTSPTTTTTKH